MIADSNVELQIDPCHGEPGLAAFWPRDSDTARFLINLGTPCLEILTEPCDSDMNSQS